jgi:Na+/melibiose symporter-like transporter
LIFYLTSQYKEAKVKKEKSLSCLQTLKKLFTDSNLLLVALFIFLFKFAPSFGTPLTFVMRDEFGWSKLWIGTMATIGSVCSIIGAALYYKYSSKLDLRKCLKWAVWLGALTTLAYLYFTPITAVVYDCINGFLGMAVTLMLLDLMARNTQSGLEATSFALLCSVSNLANTSDNLVGGWLFPILGLPWLIIIAAGCSFLCLPLIKRLKI